MSQLNTYQLTPYVIQQCVPHNSIGFYRLGVIRRGKFVPRYYGRSDTDLRRRLLQHAGAEKATHFRFTRTHTIYRCFALECAEWHLVQPYVTNKRHPDAPNGIAYTCPYCDFGKATSWDGIVDSWAAVM